MTRRLIMWNLMTLDGYFEGPKKWDLDFHERVWGPELEEFGLQQLDSAGAILYGRVTYEGMASYWSSATGRTADRMAARGNPISASPSRTAPFSTATKRASLAPTN